MRGTAEVESLIEYLASLRRQIVRTIGGLGEDVQTSPVGLPSAWTPVGLVHHLTMDGETFWMAAVVAGDAQAQSELVENGWLIPEGLSPAEVLAAYEAAGKRTEEILRATDLDAAPQWWPDFFGDFRLDTVREVVLHHTLETSRHLGQLDAALELRDGRQYLVLT